MILIIAAVAICFSVIGILAGDKIDGKIRNIARVVMLVLWIVEAAIGTFRFPFMLSGNGYFASWIGVLACLKLGMPMLPEHMQVRNIQDAFTNAAAGGAPDKVHLPKV